MSRALRLVTTVGVSVLVLGALTPAAQVEYTNNFKYNSGQSVQPVFEGWSHAPDGSINMHFGYLNRNYVEEPTIPIGPNNTIQPGGPDRGQPTFFYTRTRRNLFTVNVPKDWGRTRELVWLLTVIASVLLGLAGCRSAANQSEVPIEAQPPKPPKPRRRAGPRSGRPESGSM